MIQQQLLRPRPVPSGRFTCTGQRLVGELSDLGGDLERVYPDACDVGLTVISERTGREIVFAIDREERDREGDLLYLDLKPAQYQRDVPNVTVRLFND